MKDMMIGVDLAKNVFQLHGASMAGDMKFRKKLSRGQFLRFMSQQPPALVIMEACGSAHFWARELVKVGHEVKLIAPQYGVRTRALPLPESRRSPSSPNGGAYFAPEVDAQHRGGECLDGPTADGWHFKPAGTLLGR